MQQNLLRVQQKPMNDAMRNKLRCISNIPNITYLHPINQEDKAPVLTELSLSGNIHNSAASLSYKQVFENTSDKSIECVYKFPSDRFFAVTALKVKVGDREILTEIMEKKKAEEKYDDAVAAGHTAVKLNFDEKLPDVIELNIGHLLPGTTAEVTVDIVCELEVIQAGYYTFVFPLEFIPRYGATEGVKGEGGSTMPAPFSLDLHLTSSTTITDLTLSHDEIQHEQNEDGTSVRLSIKNEDKLKAKDIVVSFSAEAIREPQVTLTKNEKHPGEVAAHISFIPRSSEEPEKQGKCLIQNLQI